MKAIAILFLLVGASLGLAATSALYLTWPSVGFEGVGRLFAGGIACGVPALLALRPRITGYLHGLSKAGRVLLALLSFMVAFPAIYFATAEVVSAVFEWCAALNPDIWLLFAVLLLPLVAPFALIAALFVGASAWVWSGETSETPRNGRLE